MCVWLFVLNEQLLPFMKLKYIFLLKLMNALIYLSHWMFTFFLILYWIRQKTINGNNDDTATIHQLFAILELIFLQLMPNNKSFSSLLLYCDTTGLSLLNFHTGGVVSSSYDFLPNSSFTFVVSAWMCLWKHEQLTVNKHEYTSTIIHFPTSILIL